MLGQIDERRSVSAADAGPGVSSTLHLPELAHVFHRDDDFDFEGLANPGVDDRHRSLHPADPVATEELRDLLQRPLGGGQPDALRRPFGDEFEPLERQREVRTALGRGHRVDLVDDHRLDADERVARRRREHQVQRLGRRDQQVGRAPDELLAVARRRVAGAHADLGRDEGLAEPFGRQLDALQRGAQVLLDVERQGSQRGDVEHARAMSATFRPRRGRQPIDRGEERGERLARARRARRSACARRRRCAASPAPGEVSARETTTRTTHVLPARTLRAPGGKRYVRPYRVGVTADLGRCPSRIAARPSPSERRRRERRRPSDRQAGQLQLTRSAKASATCAAGSAPDAVTMRPASVIRS